MKIPDHEQALSFHLKRTKLLQTVEDEEDVEIKSERVDILQCLASVYKEIRQLVSYLSVKNILCAQKVSIVFICRKIVGVQKKLISYLAV